MSLARLISRLSSPCFLIGHGHLLITRVNDALSLECERCHEIVKPILTSSVITTPLPQVVGGAVTTKARPVSPKRAIVTQMRRR